MEEKIFGKDKAVSFKDIITCSTSVIGLISIAKKASQSDVTMLITGESGTGKELFARAIHYNSRYKKGPFVTVNCAGISDTLLESELFGYEEGAFTDAVSRKRGKFELAEGGTLFLDEIGDLGPAAQAKTLRAIEEKKFERLGGEESITVHCRIIAATNRKLSKEMREGRFREDLFYRLDELNLALPPLRDRKDDIPLLVNHFIKEFNKKFHKGIRGASQDALSLLMKHKWPGNVRELRSLIKSGAAMVERDMISVEDLPFNLLFIEEQSKDPFEQNLSMRAVEKEHILKVLNLAEWNKAKAANALKIARPTLDKKIKQYKLKK